MARAARISADLPRSRTGRLYHLGVAPGELARVVLTCGEPARARRVAKRFDSCEVVRRHREFLTITGRYHGMRLSLMATGIGPDNTAIAVIEAAQIEPVMIPAIRSVEPTRMYQ